MRRIETMNARPMLFEELEALIASGEIGRRAEALRRVTDLFASGSAVFSDEQREVFDDVMSRLVREIDITARAAFGRRLAGIPRAPSQVLRTLALDDEISVAAPVLSTAEGLDDEVLVEGARTKSQEHLLAISRRAALAEAVTDVLVERGNGEVALSTAANPGARFSAFGYSALVERSGSDGDLAVRLWSRPELPRRYMLAIFADASETVRAALLDANPGNARLIQDMIAKASDELQTRVRQDSAEFSTAESRVRSLHESGELDEDRLAAFARAGKFDETTIALSLMCSLPIGVIERAATQAYSEQIMILAKAANLSWETTRAILRIQAGTKPTSLARIDSLYDQFRKLSAGTASKALQFYRLRERTSVVGPN